MHPFPPSDELSFLIGSELAQIIVDPYEVRFLLVSKRTQTELRSGNAFAYRDGEAEDIFQSSSGCRTQAPIRFHALLHQTVSALTVTAMGDELTLTFESGHLLTTFSEVGGKYESGMISGTVDGADRLWVF
jgi:hypothetical protein